ncbi:MAG: hypothetical protein R2706_10045 [Acidimicrobiales bacterium]
MMTLSSLMLVAAALLFTVADGALFALAIGMRSTQASLFSVCLSLYIMDYIGKRQLTDIESRRIVYSGAAWLLGSVHRRLALGCGVCQRPFYLSALTTTAGAAWYFWRLRLHRNPVLLGPVSEVTSPAANVVRFIGQRHLRIAYGITVSRAVFWAVLFIYGPIYVIEAGLPAWVAGSFLSIASAMLLLSPVIRRIADRYGSRSTIVGALLFIAVCMVGVA